MAAPTPEEVLAFLRSRCDGIDVLTTPDAHFVYYDPALRREHDRQHPFVTLVLTDAYDQASDLARRGAYRLSIGVPLGTYKALFGDPPAWNKEGGVVATGHDFKALDTVTPQPFYAPLGWISVNSPDRTWPRCQSWLLEAHAHAKATSRAPSPTSPAP